VTLTTLGGFSGLVLVFVVVPVLVFVLLLVLEDVPEVVPVGVPPVVRVSVAEVVSVVVLVFVLVFVPVEVRVVSLRGTVVSFTFVVPEVSVSAALAPAVTGTPLRLCSDTVPSLLLTCPSRGCADPPFSRGAAG
jgi:hypothetical protein